MLAPEEVEPLPRDAYRALEEAVGPENVSEEPGVLDGYAWQPTFNISPDSWADRPAAVVLPGSTEETQGVVRVCNAHGIKFKAHSTGWGIFNACMSGSVILDMRRMNRIVEIDEKNMYAVIEPYVSGAALHAELTRRGLNCHIIGAGAGASPLASATSGWGNSWDSIYMSYSPRNVLATEWVLPTGELLRLGTLGQDGTWFSGDGPGPSLRGLMRGWAGAMGGIGVFTRVAVKIFNWPGPAEVTDDGLLLDFDPPIPDNFRMFMAVLPDSKAFADALYKIGEAEVGYMSAKNSIGMLMAAAMPHLLRKLPEAPMLVRMLDAFHYQFQHILAGNSERELAYQEKTFRKIISDHDGFLLDLGDTPLGPLIFWGLVKSSMPPLIFRMGGQFTNFCGFDESWDAMVRTAEDGEKIKRKWIDRGGLLEDLADNAWMLPQEDGMFAHAEQLVLYDPRDERQMKLLPNALANGLLSAIRNCQYPGPMGINPQVRQLLSPMMSHYNHWTKKFKDALDPLNVADDIAYTSEEIVDEIGMDLAELELDLSQEELVRLVTDRMGVMPPPRESTLEPGLSGREDRGAESPASNSRGGKGGTDGTA